MADISDVSTYLANAASAAVYPNGIAQPSVAGMDVRVFEGWPNPDQLDRDLAGQMLQGTPPVPVPRAGGPLANVSVFPMLGANVAPYQILNHTWTITPPVFGLIVSVTGGDISISGTPTVGEYVTVIVNGEAYSQTGATSAEVISNLALSMPAELLVTFDSVSLTFGYYYKMAVRQGAVATLGRVLHRQKQSVMLTVWAPTHVVRTSLAQAIDIALKKSLVVTMPDTSLALVTYNRTNVIDEQQMATIYRRDLIYDVEYATVEQFPGYVVTTIDVTIAKPDKSVTAEAIT